MWLLFTDCKYLVCKLLQLMLIVLNRLNGNLLLHTAFALAIEQCIDQVMCAESASEYECLDGASQLIALIGLLCCTTQCWQHAGHASITVRHICLMP